MTKELSIKAIKKELIDKISTNEKVLKHFENVEKQIYDGACIKEYGMDYVKNKYIYDHDVSCNNYDNFISVEVCEYEQSLYSNKTCHSYNVAIMVAVSKDSTIKEENTLDNLSVLLGNIATELYPNRDTYSNKVVAMEHTSALRGKYNQLVRVIQFTIS